MVNILFNMTFTCHKLLFATGCIFHGNSQYHVKMPPAILQHLTL